MKEINLIKTLLTLRLTYYRVRIFERLRRFKILLFFVLATVIPTITLLLQAVQSASLGLIHGTEYTAYFINLTIFQLILMIWVSSQYDCLKIPDVECYFRTLKIQYVHLLIIELIFISIINLPFIIFLLIGAFSLAAKQLILLSASHFVYLLSSIFFLSMCIIFLRSYLIALLIIANLIFVYFNGLMTSALLSAVLLLISYFFVIKHKYFPLQANRFFSFSRLHLSRFLPNIYLNLKGLFIWNKGYTVCIFGLNLLVLSIFVSYTLARVQQLHIEFLIMLNVIMFFCALLSYKISETRQAYGSYFSMFYNRINYHFFDLFSIYMIVLFHFIVVFFIGLYLGVSLLLMLKSILISALSLTLFVIINRNLNIYGPILSLLSLVGILMVSRGLL